MRVRDSIHSDQYPRSYYAATAPVSFTLDRLEGRETADVCVIGAGFTGLNTAIELADRGYKVVVVEQNRVGWGASGRNGGQVIGGYGLQYPTDNRMASLFTNDDRRTLYGMGKECVDILQARVDRFDIDCDLVWGYYDAAETARPLESLKETYRAFQDMGAPHVMRIVEGDEARTVLNTTHYVGGLYHDGWGHVHPLKLCHGLADGARSLGVKIFEDSRVQRLSRGEPLRIDTGYGEVVADRVIVAANGYLGTLLDDVGRKSIPVGSYMMATEPLGDKATKMFPKNVAVADQREIVDYYRLSTDGRLLFGGLAAYSGQHPSSIQKALTPGMLKVFPDLKSVKVDYEWGGLLRVSANRIPQLGAVSDKIYYAMSYAGHGVAPSHLSARLLAEAIDGDKSRYDLLARIPHKTIPGGFMRQPLFALGMAWVKLMDRFG